MLFWGASGAGKTTLLNLLGGMDRATSGAIIIDGKNITGFNKKELANYEKLVYDCSGETWFLFFSKQSMHLSDEKVFVGFWHIHAKTPRGTVAAE